MTILGIIKRHQKPFYSSSHLFKIPEIIKHFNLTGWGIAIPIVLSVGGASKQLAVLLLSH
jgi:hypothetical protein